MIYKVINHFLLENFYMKYNYLYKIQWAALPIIVGVIQFTGKIGVFLWFNTFEWRDEVQVCTLEPIVDTIEWEIIYLEIVASVKC